MNRHKRDYCSKNSHPKWKAWSARYDMTIISWPWQGNFCIYCGARVDGIGSGPPDLKYMGRLRVLRGNLVTYADYEAEQARTRKHREKKRELLLRINSRNSKN